jgi:hypothetical protein
MGSCPGLPNFDFSSILKEGIELHVKVSSSDVFV